MLFHLIMVRWDYSLKIKNYTYSVWFVREAIGFFKTRLARGGFLCYNRGNMRYEWSIASIYKMIV
mgnify:CR=1 FL=1